MAEELHAKPRNPGFTQVCIWPGTLVGPDKIKEFEAFIAEEFNGVRAQYLEEYVTLPDLMNGVPVPNTGGRNDVVFAVHEDDVAKFAVPRLLMGIRWVEDVLANEDHRLHREHTQERSIYPNHVREYWSWDLNEEQVNEDEE